MSVKNIFGYTYQFCKYLFWPRWGNKQNKAY